MLSAWVDWVFSGIRFVEVNFAISVLASELLPGAGLDDMVVELVGVARNEVSAFEWAFLNLQVV